MSDSTSALNIARLSRDGRGNSTYLKTPVRKRDPNDTILLGQAIEAEQTAFAYMRASAQIMHEAMENNGITSAELRQAKLHSKRLATTGELLHRLSDAIIVGTSVPFDYKRLDPRESILWKDEEIVEMTRAIEELNRNITVAEAEAEEKRGLM
ncbi:unnamed protein product [Zymoseptoria tritici ST99CH_3D7]|uniref:Uncharacterized protein n=1 Tax=Zymoseptoria tritici (strain ST99CH_3D7) TaxID=1276538 RepID=A0A1X7RUB7_ZYMT9|nr:unnamed protein product [Zymoseptoria tritici ST99CH_3D7]